MARRRIKKAGAEAPAAPAAVAAAPAAVAAAPPAPAPTPPPPVAAPEPPPPVTTTEVAPPAAAALPAKLSPALASIFAVPFAAPANLAPDEEGQGLAQLRFYSGKGATVADVNKDLPNITKGTPYLYCPTDERTFHRFGGLHYAALRSYVYYAAHGGDYSVIKAWAQDPGKKAMVNGAEVFTKECVLTVGIILPSATEPLPTDCAPAICTIDTFRGAQCRGPKALIRAQVASTTPEWAKQGANGAVAGATPRPEFRVSATVAGASKPTKDGQYEYVIVTMFPQTVEMPQMVAIDEWMRDASMQVECAEYLAAFDARVADITAKM